MRSFQFVSGEVIFYLKRVGLVNAFWEIDGTGFGCGERVGWSGKAEVVLELPTVNTPKTY